MWEIRRTSTHGIPLHCPFALEAEILYIQQKDGLDRAFFIHDRAVPPGNKKLARKINVCVWHFCMFTYSHVYLGDLIIHRSGRDRGVCSFL